MGGYKCVLHFREVDRQTRLTQSLFLSKMIKIDTEQDRWKRETLFYFKLSKVTVAK
jgi:hypothetical protein